MNSCGKECYGKNKKVARIIFNIYHNFWVEFFGRIIIFILYVFNMFMIIIGSRIREKKFRDFSWKSFVIMTIGVLIFYLLYKWAKHQIKDELKEQGLIDEEED